MASAATRVGCVSVRAEAGFRRAPTDLSAETGLARRERCSGPQAIATAVTGRHVGCSASRFSTAPKTAANAFRPLAAGIARFAPGSDPAGPHRILAVLRGVDRRRSNAVAKHPHVSLSARRGAARWGTLWTSQRKHVCPPRAVPRRAVRVRLRSRHGNDGRHVGCSAPLLDGAAPNTPAPWRSPVGNPARALPS